MRDKLAYPGAQTLVKRRIRLEKRSLFLLLYFLIEKKRSPEGWQNDNPEPLKFVMSLKNVTISNSGKKIVKMSIFFPAIYIDNTPPYESGNCLTHKARKYDFCGGNVTI